VIGIADGALGEKMARVLQQLGCQHALIVHGEDGLDEISIAAPTQIWELKADGIQNYTVTPEGLGLTRASVDAIRGGSAEENVVAMKRVLAGEKGPHRDVVLLNAAAVLTAGDAVQNIGHGIARASEAIDSGRAMEKLLALAALSQTLT
jgi:anthranilate phosphoribosyltransferase